jgi:hypothetical protein
VQVSKNPKAFSKRNGFMTGTAGVLHVFSTPAEYIEVDL